MNVTKIMCVRKPERLVIVALKQSRFRLDVTLIPHPSTQKSAVKLVVRVVLQRDLSPSSKAASYPPTYSNSPELTTQDIPRLYRAAMIGAAPSPSPRPPARDVNKDGDHVGFVEEAATS